MSAHDRSATEPAAAGRAEPAGTAKAASPCRQIPALDGVRGLAILAVMVFHLSLAGRGQVSPTTLDDAAAGIFQLGWAGVDLFFVLSGFLITGVLLDAKGRINYYRHFYARRVLRIWPAFALLLFLLIAVVAPLESSLAEPTRALGQKIVWYGSFTNNILVAFVDRGESPDFRVAGHLWSIAVEEQFYLIWPFLVAMLSRRALVTACGIAILAAFVTRVAFVVDGTYAEASYVLMPARMDGFAFGALAALAVRTPAGLSVLRGWVPWGFAVSLAALGAVLILGSSSPTDNLMRTIGLSAFPLLFGSLLVYVLSANEGDLGYGALVSTPMRTLGKYSYALYLFHLPIAVILASKLADMIDGASVHGRLLFGQMLFIAIAGTASFGAAWLSWQLVEEPFLRLKGHFPYGTNASAPRWPRLSWFMVPATLAALGLMVFLIVRGGWFEKPAPNDAALAITSSMFREDASGDAVHIMLVGDSITRSLSVGLYGEQEDEGFVLRDISVNNCGVMPGDPGRDGSNLAARCNGVRERWRPYVDLLDPDVVVLQVSVQDGAGLTTDGGEAGAGSPSSETTFRIELQDAVDVFSARGAHVVLLTAPYITPTIIEPTIIDQLNEEARFVADANGSDVSLIELDRLLSQDGDYRNDLSGIAVRSNDDIHFTVEGSELVGAWLAPQLIDVANEAATADRTPPDGLNRLANADTIGEGAWQGWHSTLAPVADGILVSSGDIAYSAYVWTDEADLPLAQGETYVVVAWVRSETETTDGEIEIIVREDGAREGESIQIYPMTNYWQPIVVEHTTTGACVRSLELHLLRLGTDAKPDAFIFRDAELRLTSDRTQAADR